MRGAARAPGRHGDWNDVFGLSSDSYGIVAAALAALVGTLGLLSIAAAGEWGRKHAPHFSAFSVGYLTAVILFHLAPDAVRKLGLVDGGLWMASGFVALFFVSLLARIYARDGVMARNVAIGFASIVALGTHSFVDGWLYEGIFHEVAPEDGSIAVLGLLLHEFPEGIIAYSLLISSGLSRSASAFLAFLLASLTTIFGALAAALTIGIFRPEGSGPLLAMSAGALIYVVGLHLAPHARQVPDRRGYVYVSLGVVFAVALIILRGFIPAIEAVEHAH